MLAPLLGLALWAGAIEWPQANAEASHRSGYALTEQSCGQAPNAYPKLRIGMREGYCAGLVASGEDGLVFPRSIAQIPGHRQFVVADMGGWDPGRGRLLLLDPDAAPGKRISELIVKLDFPFGLQTGPDGKIYASTSETIFRFDPLAADPKSAIENIIQKLPGRKVTLSDGTEVEESVHPLKPFIFDKTGRIFVSVGAPTDSCLKPISTPCAAGEGTAPFAALWMFTPPNGGIFPALKAGDPNPRRDIYARGLRNSMALAVHPEFPADGFAFLQGENGRDLLDPMEPNEELNAIEKGKHYGWPYCYDISTASPEFKSFLRTDPRYRNLCANTALYRQPLLAAASACVAAQHVLLRRQANSRSCKASSLSHFMATSRPAAASSSTTSTPRAFRKSASRRCATASTAPPIRPGRSRPSRRSRSRLRVLSNWSPGGTRSMASGHGALRSG